MLYNEILTQGLHEDKQRTEISSQSYTYSYDKKKKKKTKKT